MPPATTQTVSERFAELYATPTSTLASRIERAIHGEATGATGPTTPAQAERLGAALGLGPGDALLELGSGRGWPGTRIASASGCRLVQTDPQAAALRNATRAAGVAQRCTVLVADGRALPFADRTFDGVTHADVLC